MIDRAPQDQSLLTDSPATAHRPRLRRGTQVLLMVVTAGVVSGIAAVLSHAAGDNIPAAILTGGAAFAGAFGLLLTTAHYTAPG